MRSDIKPKYVDGFVLAVPNNKINEYLRLARMCDKIWLEHGALEYRECVGDDLKIKYGNTFSENDQNQTQRDCYFLIDYLQIATSQ